jgi:hypothetical protein
MSVSFDVLPCARYEIAPISMKADITIRAQTNLMSSTWVDLFYCGVWKPSEDSMLRWGTETLKSPPDLSTQNYSL